MRIMANLGIAIGTVVVAVMYMFISGMFSRRMTRFIRAFGRGSTFIFLPLIFIIVYHISFIIT